MPPLLLDLDKQVYTLSDFAPVEGPLTALGVHCYAGGFVLGVQRHFAVEDVFERGGYGQDQVETNTNVKVHPDLETWPTDKYDPESLDLVFGNPPCAPFSVNNKTGVPWQKDPRVDDIRSQFDLLLALRPKVWIWESVKRAYTLGKPLVDDLARRAIHAGYHVSHVLLDAQTWGAPQQRRRYFCVIHRVAIPWAEMPLVAEPPMVGDVLEAIEKLDREALDPTGEIPMGPIYRETAPEVSVDKYLPITKPNEPLRHAYDRAVKEGIIPSILNDKGQHRGRPAWGCKRLGMDVVAPTLVGYLWVHPSEDRAVTMNELKALQTFPVDFKLQGRPGAWPSYLARGVLPIVADWVAAAMAWGCLENKPIVPGQTEVDVSKPRRAIKPIKQHLQGTLFPSPDEVEETAE